MKIQIKSTNGDLIFVHNELNNTIKKTLEKAVSVYAYLGGANLGDANLGGAKNIPQLYINTCSQQMLYIFTQLKHELPRLRKKIVDGQIEGTQYEGDCCCLIGTLGGGNDECINTVVASMKYYDKGLHNPAEQWFYQIREGDTPENSLFARHALKLIDEVLKQ